eukprot:scaffold598779_cov18-Prasinocladus_malaysianus.AAC.1
MSATTDALRRTARLQPCASTTGTVCHAGCVAGRLHADLRPNSSTDVKIVHLRGLPVVSSGETASYLEGYMREWPGACHIV